jgi:hypothetical protein
MSITIRHYQPSDRSAVIALMDTFIRYIQAIDDQHRTDYKAGSAEYFTDRMIHVCQGNQGIVYLACDQDEKMEAVSAAPGVIDELFVSDTYRGQHIIGEYRNVSQKQRLYDGSDSRICA